jgi:sRNA-binding regulator protein Hfq
MIHYVYRISNIKENKHYYGVRSSSIEPKLDLGVKYFSSSSDKEFINEQKENKYKFKYKIIKTFETRKEAINLEIFLHNKFDVGCNVSFYNKSKQSGNKFDRSGISHTNETKDKIKSKIYSEAEKVVRSENAKGIKNGMYGKKHSDESKKKISESKKGTKSSDDTINKLKDGRRKGINHPLFGKNHSEESKKKISESKKGTIISDDHKKKISEKLLGKINKRSVSVSIYNKEGIKVITIATAFKRKLKEYDLPQALIASLDNNTTIFESNRSKIIAKNRGQEQYIGWYARRDNKNELDSSEFLEESEKATLANMEKILPQEL